jgi:hypothetical protein
MIRLRPHRVGKAESLFDANLKPFFDSIGQQRTSYLMANGVPGSLFKGVARYLVCADVWV